MRVNDCAQLALRMSHMHGTDVEVILHKHKMPKGACGLWQKSQGMNTSHEGLMATLVNACAASVLYMSHMHGTDVKAARHKHKLLARPCVL